MSMQTRGYNARQAHPEFDLWLAQRLLAGWHPKAIVAASDNRINVRTAYRWARDLLRLEEVLVGGYVATFAIRRGSPPSRLTEWARAGRMIDP